MNPFHRWIWLTGIVAAACWSAAAAGAFDDGLGGRRMQDAPWAHPDDEQPAEPPKKKVEDPHDEDLLTAEQINRVKYMELRAMRLEPDTRPDPVQVTIPQSTIDEFLEAIENNEDYRGKKTRREFMKLTPPQKLHQIAVYQGASFADKVTIRTDPEVFVAFKKKVLPIVLRSCATAGCHVIGTDEPVGFRLHPDPKRTAPTVYTNFITLNRARSGDRLVIDRAKPEDSLLLSCMLPLDEVPAKLRHPGDVKFRAGISTRSSPAYRNILSWIKSLKHPAEDYGIGGAEGPHEHTQTTQPADKAKPDEHDHMH